MGQQVYNQTFALSRRVNIELIPIILSWIDDPEMENRWGIIEEEGPIWRQLKKEQRNAKRRKDYDEERQIKINYLERIKNLFQYLDKTTYKEMVACFIRNKQWMLEHISTEEFRFMFMSVFKKLDIQQKRKRKNLRKEIASIIPRAGPRTTATLLTNQSTTPADFLIPILSPFSPQQQHKAEIHQEFTQALALTVSNMLPWKMIIGTHVSRTRRLSELPVHYPEDTKKDTASKLMHLLAMDQAGELTINQDKPFGDIVIEPSANTEPEGTFTIIDNQANEYEFNWHNLSDAQKNKVIADIKQNRILCKVG